MRTVACLLLLIVFVAPAAGADDNGFVPLFNGRDLSGWVNVNCAPETFRVEDGLIVCSGKPTGVIRTEKHYENFILELEWKHLIPGGNAGLFIWSDALPARGVPFTRSIEVQILDGHNTENYTSHGDVFAIHGATLEPDRPHPNGWARSLPSERRCKPAGEWNHYRVTCQDGQIKLAVNGKEVSGGSQCLPRKGYICLESEGGVVHFRNLRIKELPSTDPQPEEVATVDEGFRSLYTGTDLRNWKTTAEHEEHWQVRDWILAYDGKCEADDPHLWSQESFRDFVMIVDWRWPPGTEAAQRPLPVVLSDGSQPLDEQGNPQTELVADAGDSGIYLRGNDKSQVNIWCWPVGSGEVYGYRTDSSMPAEVRRGVTPKERADMPIGQWNRFEITMRGDRLKVVLNGKTVIEDAHLPGVPAEGPIALQHHGNAIQFANIFIRPLED